MHLKKKERKKVPLKAEQVIQLKAIQQEHEQLKLEYSKSIQLIQTLEVKVDDLKKQIEQKEGDTEAVTQTVDEKCDYVGEGEYDLDAHVFSEECEQHFTCYHCGRNVQTSADLMIQSYQ